MFQPLDSATIAPTPQTVEAVVDLLYEDLSLRDRMVMAQLSEYELDTSVYLALAKMVRKEFGLYSGNDQLIESCRDYMGSSYDSFEDPAMIIIKELWKKIKHTHHLRLVKSQD